MNDLEAVNQMFSIVAGLTDELAGLNQRRMAEIQDVDAVYGPKIQRVKVILDETETELKSYLRKHQAGIFKDGDRVETQMGSAIRAVITRVRKARGVLAKLKALGLGAVKVAESVDWDEIEKWPDEKLEAVGTNRVTKVEFNYELKAGNDSRRDAEGRDKKEG